MFSMTRNPIRKKLLTLSLALCCALPGGLVWPQDTLTGDVRVTVTPANIRESIPVAGAGRRVTMSLRGLDVTDALRALARKGGFNVLIDESVKGVISVDLNNITIQQALETLKTYANLSYSVQGGNLMVADATTEKGKAFQKNTTRLIPLRYANARVTADLLNRTVFADRVAAASAGGGGTAASGGGAATGGTPAGAKPVTADPHTNSLIVLGSPSDIRTVQEHVAALDQPRESRTWRLSQANVLDVATMLASSLFNEGQPALVVGAAGGGGASASGSGTAAPSTMPVVAEKIEESQGTSDSTQSSSGGGASGGGDTLLNSITLRARIKENQSVQVSPTGPIIIPDTRLNALTLMGTAQQIAMAESLIPTLDRKVPQVILDAALVEITEDGRKELGIYSGFNFGHFSFGFNNITNFNNTANVGRATSADTPTESILRYTANPVKRSRQLMYQINALVNTSKARMLAHPTVVTASDNETVISITDEILRSVSITTGTAGAPPTTTYNIGEAGIVLNILPRVGADGTVSMRIRPLISTIRGVQESLGNEVTLLSKREAMSQNTLLQDGETFVLGGLIHDTDTDAVERTPGLSRLPIVSALARNSTRSKHRSELVIMITPHILNDESNVTRYARNIPGSQLLPSSIAQARREASAAPGASPGDGILPVSLNGAPAASRPRYLPDMEPVQVINASKAPASDASAPMLRGPRPLKPAGGPLLPDEMLPAPDRAGAGNPGTAKNVFSSGARPMPRPLSSVAAPPYAMMATTQAATEEAGSSKAPPPPAPLATSSKNPPAIDSPARKPAPSAVAGSDISDDAVRAIMRKFE